ncbi:PREDICTED: uncharacterized protein LOC109479991 [Branchiostoma belcheri]|uniref:Uncharacterized protein LOC109479991 n=1 Tax=Branchiostoma belcheri TaxID=7741 RepID=A0A6P4ZU80_BRABE|nr:PREDICTED: uncharacterized protein LOC109479991 [Branchiostoma belcheri]
MELRTQKILTNIGFGIWFFIAGVEYAVILPTAWLYVESLGGDKFFFGMVFSSFSVASLVFGIVFGIWADRVGKTKWIVIFANVWGIAGSALYSVGMSKYLILGARLLSGAGAGVGSAIMAHLTHTTTNEERTRTFSFFIATRFIGVMVGPGFNFVLRLCDFYIGPFKIDAYTAPGVFMAALTILLEIYMVFFVYDLPYIDAEPNSDFPPTSETVNKGKENIQSSTTVPSNNLTENMTVSQGTAQVESNPSSVNSYNQQSYESFHTCRSNMQSMTVESSEFYKTASFENVLNGEVEGHTIGCSSQPNGAVNSEHQDHISEAEDGITVNASDGAILEKTSNQSGPVTQETDKPSFFTLLADVLREETVVLLAVIFCIIFNQVTVETIATPLSQEVFRWGEKENSIFYMCAAAEMLACYVGIGCISKKFQDRTIIFGGLTLSCLSLAWLVVFIKDNTYNPSLLPYFIVGAALQLMSFAPIMIASTSLFSKVTDRRIQGLSHGIRRAVSSVACIIGPLWAGATLHMLNVLLGVMVAMQGLVMILALLSFRRLKDPHHQQDSVPSLMVNTEADEQTPLLKDAQPAQERV